MTSGFGATGGVGRCYPFWQDFSKCLENCEDPIQCLHQREVTLPPCARPPFSLLLE